MYTERGTCLKKVMTLRQGQHARLVPAEHGHVREVQRGHPELDQGDRSREARELPEFVPEVTAAALAIGCGRHATRRLDFVVPSFSPSARFHCGELWKGTPEAIESQQVAMWGEVWKSR